MSTTRRSTFRLLTASACLASLAAGTVAAHAGRTPVDPASVLSAMSAPAFAPERHEIWYTDGNSGFYSVRLTSGAWPRTT